MTYPFRKANLVNRFMENLSTWEGSPASSTPEDGVPSGELDEALDKLLDAAPLAANAIREGMAATGASLDLLMPCFLALAFCASAGSADIASPRGRLQPLVAAMFGTGPSGVGKTPAWLWFLGFLETLEDENLLRYEEECQKYKNELKTWKSKFSAENRNYHRARKAGVGVEQALEELERIIALEPQQPVLRRNIVKDTTRLPFLRAVASAPFLLVGSSEGDSVLSGETMKFTSVHCSSLDGEGTGALRIDGDVSRARNPRPVYCILTQPPVFEQYILDTRRKAKDIGLLSRSLLFSVKGRSGVYRGKSVGDEATQTLLAKAKELIAESWRIYDQNLDRIKLELSPEAVARWEEIDKFFREGLSAGEHFVGVEDYASKAPLLVLRIAASTHYLCERGAIVDVKFVEFAYAVVMASFEEYKSYFSPEACQERLAESLRESLNYFRTTHMRILSKNYFLKMGNQPIRSADSLGLAISRLIRSREIRLVDRDSTRYIDLNPNKPIPANEIFWGEKQMLEYVKSIAPNT